MSISDFSCGNEVPVSQIQNRNLMDLSPDEYQKAWDQMVRDAYNRSEEDRRSHPEKYEKRFRGEMRRPKPSEY